MPTLDSLPQVTRITAWRAYAAHVDAWQTHGRVFGPHGGGVKTCPGLKLMASGLDYDYLNTACVLDHAAADLECARVWFAERGLPWGVIAPTGTPWRQGTRLLGQRLMTLAPERYRPVQAPPGLVLASAAREDLEVVVAIDNAAFGSEVVAARAWLAPLCASELVEVAVASLSGVPVATGYATRCEGEAGTTVYVGGIGVIPGARRRGVGTALSSWLVGRAFKGAADFAHLQTESDGAARIYAALGFSQSGSIDIYTNR